jgi:putative spermidine/putrescine transport system ATP-binding protein
MSSAMSSATRTGEIDLVAVTKRFGDTVAVDAISLNIPHGSYCCLLGPSGCGKTTILRMIAGHEAPTEGDIRIGGGSVLGQSPLRRGTAMMFQSYALFPHLSVLENVAFSLKMRGIRRETRRQQAQAMLRKVGLERFAERLPAQLSGGQQQRVALARSLITNPRVLLLDEPLSALDEYLRLRMRGELRRIQRELGITFVHVTHTQLEAIAVADTLVVMDQGRIDQASAPRVIFNTPRSPYVARFIGGQNVLSGAIESVADDIAMLKGDAGARFTVALSGARLAPGSLVYFAIRRDRIALARATDADGPPGKPNTVRGTVHAIEYQGSYVKVTIDLSGPEEFVANVSDVDFFRDPLEIGDPVLAGWASRDVHVLDGADRAAAAETYAGAAMLAK